MNAGQTQSDSSAETPRKSEKQSADLAKSRKSDLEDKLDAAGWGLFFIWVGIAFLADVGWGIGLLGVGVITLAEQLIRVFFKLKPEAFWLLVGCGFALGGLWELFEVQVPLVPILLIACGVLILASAIGGKHLTKKNRRGN